MAHLLESLWSEIRRISRDTTPRYAVHGGAVAANDGSKVWFALAVLMMLMGIALAWWAVRS